MYCKNIPSSLIFNKNKFFIFILHNREIVKMTTLSRECVDKIVDSCLCLYDKLPKGGKPVNEEWTVVSCVVQRDRSTGTCVPVSLATGSKCAGAALLCSTGDRLNDSHAEVLARRGLLLYLYHNIERASQNELSIFERRNTKFLVKDDIDFIFYSSQLPCGDASILPKSIVDQDCGDLLQSCKRQSGEDICNIALKKTKLDVDIQRTGAKCLPDAVQDPKLPGIKYHLFGQVRTKPGRGDRTLSVSCSDKMARWIHVGIQGALLNILCGPIYIKYFIFGGGVPYSEESLNRALLNRKKVMTVFTDSVPEFYQSSIPFTNIKVKSNLRPAPGSIIWIKTNGSPEVTVQGRKLGLTKKMADSPKYSVCISKYKLYERFLAILKINEDIKQSILHNSSLESVPYNEMKKKSKSYYDRWCEVKEKFFGTWTVKPDMWNFCINIP